MIMRIVQATNFGEITRQHFGVTPHQSTCINEPADFHIQIRTDIEQDPRHFVRLHIGLNQVYLPQIDSVAKLKLLLFTEAFKIKACGRT